MLPTSNFYHAIDLVSCFVGVTLCHSHIEFILSQALAGSPHSVPNNCLGSAAVRPSASCYFWGPSGSSSSHQSLERMSTKYVVLPSISGEKSHLNGPHVHPFSYSNWNFLDPLVISHSHGSHGPFIDGLPINSMVILHGKL